MAERSKGANGATDAADTELLRFFRAIEAGDATEVAGRLAVTPALAHTTIRGDATRESAETYFLERIHHQVYAGHTALHVAAGAFQRDTARTLVELGARPRARNRRGAEPLHAAAFGSPGSDAWNPPAQQQVIEYLIDVGADPDAPDTSGITPLHRAVRTRSSAAARTLLERGADPVRGNKSGSTPLHLAVQNTGRSGSGSPDAIEQQREIIVLLLAHGARPTDPDAKGKTVTQSATSDWILELLEASG